MEKEKSQLTALLGDDIEIITLYDNYSFKSVLSSADKVRGIGNILMMIFIAVSLLVVLSSMMRLMEEERAQIACLKTLGYSSFSIVARYLLFALVALLAGGGGGFFVGYGVSRLMCYVFDYSYDMPPISVVVNPSYYFLSVGVVAAITPAIFILGMLYDRRYARQSVETQTAQKGKRVFLENIPVLWNRLAFKYKSSLRNVLRYKMRFFMMLVSVAVSAGSFLPGWRFLICACSMISALRQLSGSPLWSLYSPDF